ncbi:MAG: hypothetical protein WDN06_22875 [Asticcacaulis sp.]
MTFFLAAPSRPVRPRPRRPAAQARLCPGRSQPPQRSRSRLQPVTDARSQ